MDDLEWLRKPRRLGSILREALTSWSTGNCSRHLGISRHNRTMPDDTEANSESMRIDPQRAHVLAENVGSVLQRVEKAAGGRKVCMPVRLLM